MNQLYKGINSMPKIKIASTDVLKTLANKLKYNYVGIERFLEIAYKVEKKVDNQEESKEAPFYLTYDQAKVDQVMKIVQVKCNKNPADKRKGKDFKSFIK